MVTSINLIQAKELLLLFNEKAEKLSKNSFLEKMIGSKVTIHWDGAEQPLITDRIGPIVSDINIYTNQV